ncbi:MAG TPA: HAD family phosphatase [Streptosporangiaceae bacterium]|nr:HAD family phosphatase [Streptosporangiaceae bacterium]
MPVRAVAFDIGGVLEEVAPPDQWLGSWQRRLGMSADGFEAALAGVDPGGLITTGGLSEAKIRQRYADALGLPEAAAQEFMADLWDWYCGELDEDLTAFAASLRPGCATAILSNSADGARREEQARYAFADLFDVIVYSHEVRLAKPDPQIYQLLCAELDVAPAELVFLDDVPENVEAALDLGIRGILHHSTPESISAIGSLLTS